MAVSSKCQHGRVICSECVVIDDSAKRAYEGVKMFVTFIGWEERIRSWVAIRLADGRVDATLYDSKQAAIRHQTHEQLCAYFSYRNAPNGFKDLVDAKLWLDMNRAAYDAGFIMIDPDDVTGGPELMIPTALDELWAQRAALIRGSN